MGCAPECLSSNVLKDLPHVGGETHRLWSVPSEYVGNQQSLLYSFCYSFSKPIYRALAC
ncbi:Uncharacterised protein [Vibrio cholerae]|nr:Uncharacterised protein [Vibrio cholerae]CSD06226.1 Uncharacterised protein [Vibrio cholerae]